LHALEDYLNIQLASARRQWASILDRRPVVSGRQVPFTPVETLLCLAASLRVNHRQYGGSTSHLAEEPVPALARLFKRPNSSILAKMANLDGSRPNGARYELEVGSRLLADLTELSRIYQLLLMAARDSGIGSEDLPDFLSQEATSQQVTLLGQEKLPQSELERAVQDRVAKWCAQRPDLGERITERAALTSVRLGQHHFARKVLRNHGHQCVFCGLAVRQHGAPAARMLIASHIKPWRVCDPQERLDPLNGLAACPTHDAAFDTGLLAVQPDIAAAACGDTAMKAAFGQPALRRSLLLPATALPPKGRYLRWHREHVYQG
jgi:putative restriction endonuclease